MFVHKVGSQPTDYEMVNFSVNDGLPSNECHDIVQDSLGYIWVATDRGLSRFDGYGFKNYGKKEGLGDLSCLKLFLDRHDNIWISTLSKKIYKYLSKSDTIIPFEYNYLLEPYYSKSLFNYMFYLDECDDVYFGIDYTGIIKITSDGQIILPDSEYMEPNQFYSYEVEDKVFLGISTDELKKPKEIIKADLKYPFSSINHQGNRVTIKRNPNQRVFGTARAFKYSKLEYIYCIEGHHYFFKGHYLQKINIGNEINDILILENGNILTAQIFRNGVRMYKNSNDFKNDNNINFIDNISASRFLEDKQKNIYVTTIEDGFFYLKSKIIKPVDLGNYSQKVISKLEKREEENLLILLDNNMVIENNLKKNTINQIYKSPGNILDIKYDSKSSEIHIAGQTSWIISEKNIIVPVGKCGNKNNNVIPIRHLVPLKKYTLSLGFEKFGIYSDLKALPEFCSDGVLPNKRFISGSDFKNDTYLLGALDGLFILKGDSLIKTDSIHPVFRSRINDIKILNGNYLLGTLGNGLGIWDGEKNITVLQKSDGILTDNIERIYVNNKSDIYLCSKSGLSKISIQSDNSYLIKNFTRHHGLSSNIVNDAIQMGDSLYIATANGLCVLTTDPLKILPKRPVIESMSVNNLDYKMWSFPKNLSYHQNNITFYFKSLDLSLNGDILYRTKLNQGEWLESKSTSINYAALNPGKYTFQVQANNRDLEWSTPMKHEFEIKKPWWKTLFFQIFGVMFIGLFIYIYYKNRIYNLQKENRIQKELASLERSALQAQMNPHFIFNCLNSIQNYIMSNNKEQAMDYLGRFARLIRQYLNASTQDLVTLDDEVSMLENYLLLEQMRFNNTFNYRFHISKDIDILNVKLPPLLIQPFVENAVLHGMKDLKDPGLITMEFKQNGELLNITIKDNGKGIKKEKSNELQKSLGMSITKKRLQYINENAKGNYSISTNSDESGTQIDIVINIK
ncbi:MAG: histidine kinase [Saprospiraceae bacterium]|nr:histidine kinase [Saprospiraceae bacterium]